MNSRERMLLAIAGEKPDRVPATLHQWQPYHLHTQMGGMSDVEAFKAVGLDAAITCYEITDETNGQWKVSAKETPIDDGKRIEYTVETPEGNLTYVHGINEMTSWVLEPMIKREQDIELLRKYRPIPTFRRDLFLNKREELGDGGIMRTFIWGYQGGCWQDAAELVGIEKLIMATFDNPEWVHELLETLLQQKFEYIEKNLKGLPIDLVETGGGASSNTIISPTMHREFCLPYDKRMHEALHALNYKVVYHTCGGMTKILDSIMENGCDASETLSPIEIGGDIADKDMEMVRRTLGKEKILIGGIDQLTVLPGTDDQIVEEVRKKFAGYGIDGGYIMSASDHFFHLDRDRLELYANAAKECVYQ